MYLFGLCREDNNFPLTFSFEVCRKLVLSSSKVKQYIFLLSRCTIMTSTLILVTGASGSGKSTIAKYIANQINESVIVDDNDGDYDGSSGTGQSHQAIVIHQDNYFLKEFIPYKYRTDDSYESESVVDWNQLRKDIIRTTASVSPSFTGHHKKTFVIVEGHILSSTSIMTNEIINAFHNIIIVLLSSTQEICHERRLNRRNDRSTKEREELSIYFESFVWPSYLKYGKATMGSFRNWILDNKDNKDKISLLELENNENGTTLTQIIESIMNKIKDVVKE